MRSRVSSFQVLRGAYRSAHYHNGLILTRSLVVGHFIYVADRARMHVPSLTAAVSGRKEIDIYT